MWMSKLQNRRTRRHGCVGLHLPVANDVVRLANATRCLRGAVKVTLPWGHFATQRKELNIGRSHVTEYLFIYDRKRTRTLNSPGIYFRNPYADWPIETNLKLKSILWRVKNRYTTTSSTLERLIQKPSQILEYRIAISKKEPTGVTHSLHPQHTPAQS